MNRIWTGLCLGGLAGLIWFSLHLAVTRIFQVDECQYIYMIRVLAAGQGSVFFTNAPAFLLPLYWLARATTHSVDLFTSARFLMAEVFWLNIVLIAVATGQRLFSLRGLVALLGAATLAPLWDYGFEIRHDNLLLTGLLLMWCELRVRPGGVRSFFIAGAMVVFLEIVAFKAFVYTIPLSLAFLAFPPPAHKSPRWKLILGFAVGMVASGLVIRVGYGAAGIWDAFLSDFYGISSVSAKATRFFPWSTLSRLFIQTPLLLALLAAALISAGAALWRNRKRAFTWDGNLPETLLVLGTLGVLFINPTPYPYNLVFWVPFVFVLAFRHAEALWPELLNFKPLMPVIGAVLVFAHLVPFGIATRRHLDWPNTRQCGLMGLAEQLTDPAKDRVYDGIGMVPTRPSIHFRWFLHSLNIQSFVKGPGPRVREMLAARPAAVFIPSYRTDWLPEADHDFIRQHYVSLADDFWVLGKVLPPGGGAFEVIHPGRYRIASLQGSDLWGTYPDSWLGLLCKPGEGDITGLLDGVPFSNRPVELTVGIHRIETASGCQPACFWVGPHCDRLSRIGRGDHQRLFANWY
jgi:hypothetical protein